MDKIIKQLPTVIGVVPGQVATSEVPIGPRVHVVWIEATVKKTGAAPALTDILGLINVKLNGKVQRAMTAAELVALNEANGEDYKLRWQKSTDNGATFGALGNAALADGDTAKFQVPIYFAEPYRKEYKAADFGAWPTAWSNGTKLASFQIELSVPNVANTSLHSLSAWVELDKELGQVVNGVPQFNITKWVRTSVGYTGAGELDITTLPRRDFLQSMHLFAQTADPITAVEVNVDNDQKRKVTKTQNDQALIGKGLNPAGLVASRFDVVFDYDDRPDSALNLNGVLDFLVKPTLASAAATTKTLTIISQSYGPPD